MTLELPLCPLWLCLRPLLAGTPHRTTTSRSGVWPLEHILQVQHQPPSQAFLLWARLQPNFKGANDVTPSPLTHHPFRVLFPHVSHLEGSLPLRQELAQAEAMSVGATHRRMESDHNTGCLLSERC